MLDGPARILTADGRREAYGAGGARSRTGSGVRGNVRRTILIWQRIASSCLILTWLLVGFSILMERIDKSLCQKGLFVESIVAPTVLSTFMLLFFQYASQDNRIMSIIDDLSKEGFLTPYEWMAKKYLQIIFYVSFSGFCAFTFVGPIMAGLVLRTTLMNCGYL
jgi:hypothetical protein